MKHTILLLLSCLVVTAEEAPKKTEPKNADKLSVKIVGSGEKKRHAITGRAGSQNLLIRYGSGKNDFFRVEPWQSKSKTVSLGKSYSVRATEDGKLVDIESSTRKTGLGSDTRLR